MPKDLFRLGARARARCLGTKMDFVQTLQCPELNMFINHKEKVLVIEKSATNLELVFQQLVRRWMQRALTKRPWPMCSGTNKSRLCSDWCLRQQKYWMCFSMWQGKCYHSIAFSSHQVWIERFKGFVDTRNKDSAKARFTFLLIQM